MMEIIYIAIGITAILVCIKTIQVLLLKPYRTLTKEKLVKEVKSILQEDNSCEAIVDKLERKVATWTLGCE
ncbi:MAG: hypothetical protein OEX12_00350 [Gammaproteobacteria bacterium]|nr:hypothetical protein [Gammaproteobacteria bacterium]